MTYDIRKAFFADQVYKTDSMALGTPMGEGWVLALKSQDTGDGYQGALFKNLETGKYVFASRGTEPDRELYKDLFVADIGQMGFKAM